ncbi:Na+/H+ antiporter NhaC [Treponema denticola OTK]|uniref:Na+/H+ antiporter NhaC n=1 Tax=Treponema denticola OTK TaxID=999434 RepID=A0A0F6MP20_TREDN|nr:SLC13 family permease [Treponema denticola]EMB20681.1 Na+/H+ antiporter NhaC [Treponema denticola OTK]
MVKDNKKMSFLAALVVIGIMMTTIMFFTIVIKSSIVTTFFIICVEVIIIGLILKHPFKELEKAGFEYTLKAMPAFFILLTVGAMVAMWIASGVVPTLIYVGLKLISPKIVPMMAMLLSSIASLVTGTSYGSIATVGVAMMGIGASMNIPLPMVAGAVISGAFFGDCLSPCSDTTNITSAATQTPLMTEIRHMLPAQLIVYILSLVIFTIQGFKYGGVGMDRSSIDVILKVLQDNFKISFVAIIPVIIVIVMLVMKLPTLLSLAGGIFSGALIGVLYQNIPVKQLIGYLQKGYFINVGLPTIEKILNRGGIASMYNMAILIVLAMFVSGILTYTGVMDSFINVLVKKIRGTVSLIIITMVLAYFISAFAGSFTLSSVITSTFMLPLYRKQKLRSENLARVIQMTSNYGGALIPWNGHAVYAFSTLGVATTAYLPYCYVNFLAPLMVIILAVTGVSMTKYTKEEMKELEMEEL